MTAGTTRRVLVQCDGATVPAKLADQSWTARKSIISTGPAADLNLYVASLGGAVLTRVGSRAADLVRIAAYAYRADQMISRGGPRDAHASRWKRHLTLCVPVNDLAYWSDATVGENLAATLRFLTDDVWEFTFTAARPAMHQLPLDIQEQELLRRPTMVTLFSGGLDSLCVLLEAAAKGERPVAVSHWSTPAHRARQEALRARAMQRFPGWTFPLIGLPIHRQGAAPADASQRSRGFLYASLGAAVAGEVGLERVSYGDNGPVSINLPINDQLVGALASRSTHPIFLDRFNRLVAELFSTPVVVTNPLQGRTRAEALAVLKTTHCEDLLPQTLSCSKWRGLPAATPHCGGCSQCVDRRFATVAAGLETYDPAGRYKRDIFLDELPDWETRTTAESYVRFAHRVYRLADEELVEQFPQVYDAVVPGDPDPEATVLEVSELAKRHAATVLTVLKTMAKRHLDPLVEGQLPVSCLLRLTMSGSDSLRDRDAVVEQGQTSGTVTTTTSTHNEEMKLCEEENVFAYTGEMWTLTYRGVTKHFKPAVGLTRLACLLKRRGHDFTAEEILVTTESTGGQSISEVVAELDGLRMEGYASGGRKLDQQSITEYTEEVRGLLRNIDQARDDEDRAWEATLEAQMQWIVHELKTGRGLGGKLKPFADNQSRRRDTIYQSLHRTLPKIAKAHYALGEHFKRSVRLGTVFSYAPEVDVHWRVELPTNKD